MNDIQIKCKYDEMVNVEDLVPYAKNNKTHDDLQIALLAKGIRALGFQHPILANPKTKEIIAGHCRLESAKLLKLAKVPVCWRTFKNRSEERAFRIADNKLASRAKDDFANIMQEIEDLDTGEIDLDLTGFLREELGKIVTSEPKEKEDGEKEPKVCPHCGNTL